MLILEDPDAPDPRAPTTPWSHWVVLNLPPKDGALETGARELPGGASAGLNDWNRPIYNGPCPSVGRHRYVFRLLALKRKLKAQPEVTRESLLRDVRGVVLAEARWVGTYERGVAAALVPAHVHPEPAAAEEPVTIEEAQPKAPPSPAPEPSAVPFTILKSPSQPLAQ